MTVAAAPRPSLPSPLSVHGAPNVPSECFVLDAGAGFILPHRRRVVDLHSPPPICHPVNLWHPPNHGVLSKSSRLRVTNLTRGQSRANMSFTGPADARRQGAWHAKTNRNGRPRFVARR